MNNELMKKWDGLLNAEGLPEIASMDQQKIIARIFENQEADIKNNNVYRDHEISQLAEGLISEAVLAGDSALVPGDIAAGINSGAAVGVGASVMGMVRRAIPNLVAFDLCGVQPMDKPTSQMFALRALYGPDYADANAKEAFHPTAAPNTMFSGRGAAEVIPVFGSGTVDVADVFYFDHGTDGIRHYQVATAITGITNYDADDIAGLLAPESANGGIVEVGEAMATRIAELQEGFNGSTGNEWNEMSFRIDKQTTEAKSRQLKAQYSIELAQDLRAVHGMDADAELNGILSNEIVVEINREIIDLINGQAQWGASGKTAGTAATGVFDVSDSGDIKGARWAGEAYKAIVIQIEKECNEIARQTGRGTGNVMIASRNVVSALAMTDTFISVGQQGFQKGLVTDTTKTVFAGTLGGRIKVFIDQYAMRDYFTVGYKGSNALDAGVFYMPYVALTPLRAADSRNFQPVLGWKTRYGLGVNPFANPADGMPGSQVTGLNPTVASMGKNGYFRKVLVNGL